MDLSISMHEIEGSTCNCNLTPAQHQLTCMLFARLGVDKRDGGVNNQSTRMA